MSSWGHPEDWHGHTIDSSSDDDNGHGYLSEDDLPLSPPSLPSGPDDPAFLEIMEGPAPEPKTDSELEWPESEEQQHQGGGGG